MDDPDGAPMLVSRHATELVEECITDFRVTIVNGPRQAGKTTLLRQAPAIGRCRSAIGCSRCRSRCCGTCGRRR